MIAQQEFADENSNVSGILMSDSSTPLSSFHLLTHHTISTARLRRCFNIAMCVVDLSKSLGIPFLCWVADQFLFRLRIEVGSRLK
jgi:hypothetical protein